LKTCPSFTVITLTENPERMKIELFLDEDVHSGLAHALRKRGYDAIHAQERDRKGLSDSDQLLFAIQQER
jgi:hypothetical protein